MPPEQVRTNPPAAAPAHAPAAAPAKPAAASTAPVAVFQPPASDYVNGHLTRAGMERVIRSGGSVSHNGAIITTVEGLPDEPQVAKDHMAADRRGVQQRYDALAIDEAAARQRGSYDIEKHNFDSRRLALEEETNRLNLRAVSSDEEHRENLRRRREQLDREEAQFNANKPKR